MGGTITSMSSTSDPTSATAPDARSLDPDDLPKIVSVDDHVIEPPDVWTSRLPSKYADVMPRSIRQKGTMNFVGGVFSFEPDDDGEEGDWWQFEDGQYPLTRLEAAVGFDRDDVKVVAITYDEMRKGCWDRDARLVDMDANWTEASMSFPSSFPRFCGQRFYEAKDKELADLCVKAYNDWQVEEWCAGTDGRLIPCIIVQLWDPQLAAAEVRRNAARGVPRHDLLGDPAVPGPAVDPRRRAATGIRCSRRAPRPAPSSTCTSGRARRCPRPRPTRRQRSARR